MNFLSFGKVYYDKKDHTMKPKDKLRPDDFISISGTKMRKLAALGATPCPNEIPSDLLEAKCIPPGFMVTKGWNIMIDYYQHVEDKQWVPYSTQYIGAPLATGVSANDKPYGTLAYKINFVKDGKTISPWHDIPLRPTEPAKAFNFVCEIPLGTTAKMEVQKKVEGNPIMHDTKRGKVRHYTYGLTFFNYGLFPQTWENPAVVVNGNKGDNDPLDVMEVGSVPFKVGEVVPVKVLGDIELIDEGEMDHKIIVLALSDPLASRVDDMAQLKAARPDIVANLIEWLKLYKTTDGKPENKLGSEEPSTKQKAETVVEECHGEWKKLWVDRSVKDTEFWLP